MVILACTLRYLRQYFSYRAKQSVGQSEGQVIL